VTDAKETNDAADVKLVVSIVETRSGDELGELEVMEARCDVRRGSCLGFACRSPRARPASSPDRVSTMLTTSFTSGRVVRLFASVTRMRSVRSGVPDSIISSGWRNARLPSVGPQGSPRTRSRRAPRSACGRSRELSVQVLY